MFLNLKMNGNIKLSILIVSFNTLDLTIECIRSVLKNISCLKCEIIVFDNNSIDGSAKAIESEFPQVNLIAHDENLGFSGGNNLAAKRAQGEYLLLLNPDTLVMNSAIAKLLAFAEQNPDACIWGGRTLFGDKTLNPASCWYRMTLWSVFCRAFGLSWLFKDSPIFNTEAYGGWDRSTIKQVDIVSGCFFLIKHGLWEKLGGFDPEFFMYGEEADLCLRAAKLYGAKPMVTPGATIIHYGGASERVHADKMVRLMKAKHLLMKRHWPSWKYALGIQIFKLDPVIRLLIYRLSYIVWRKKHEEAETWSEVWSRRIEWLKV